MKSKFVFFFLSISMLVALGVAAPLACSDFSPTYIQPHCYSNLDYTDERRKSF